MLRDRVCDTTEQVRSLQDAVTLASAQHVSQNQRVSASRVMYVMRGARLDKLREVVSTWRATQATQSLKSLEEKLGQATQTLQRLEEKLGHFAVDSSEHREHGDDQQGEVGDDQQR